jgi:hypothetical protein
MRKTEEIEQLAEEFLTLHQDGSKVYHIKIREAIEFAYTQCQEDMADEINLLKNELSQLKSQFPKYAIKGDYCAVCGCTEFWNDDEEE